MFSEVIQSSASSIVGNAYLETTFIDPVCIFTD